MTPIPFVTLGFLALAALGTPPTPGNHPDPRPVEDWSPPSHLVGWHRFCAGDPVPAWVERTDGPVSIAFAREVLVAVERAGVSVYPARGYVDPDAAGKLSGVDLGDGLLAGLIRVRRTAPGWITFTGAPTDFRRSPPVAAPDVAGRPCGRAS